MGKSLSVYNSKGGTDPSPPGNLPHPRGVCGDREPGAPLGTGSVVLYCACVFGCIIHKKLGHGVNNISTLEHIHTHVHKEQQK